MKPSLRKSSVAASMIRSSRFRPLADAGTSIPSEYPSTRLVGAGLGALATDCRANASVRVASSVIPPAPTLLPLRSDAPRVRRGRKCLSATKFLSQTTLPRPGPPGRPVSVLDEQGEVDGLGDGPVAGVAAVQEIARSEEHTSELQSRENLVCRLLL